MWEISRESSGDYRLLFEGFGYTGKLLLVNAALPDHSLFDVAEITGLTTETSLKDGQKVIN